MAKLSESTKNFRGLGYRRKVEVSSRGIFRIYLPEVDGLPRFVEGKTLTVAEKEEKKILDDHVELNWEERKVIRILFDPVKDNSEECKKVNVNLMVMGFNGFGYTLQAGVLTERYARTADGFLYEYRVGDCPIPGTVDIDLRRTTKRLSYLIDYDENVVAMLCDVIAKTNILSKALSDLLDCEKVALKAAEWDPSRLLGGAE